MTANPVRASAQPSLTTSGSSVPWGVAPMKISTAARFLRSGMTKTSASSRVPSCWRKVVVIRRGSGVSKCCTFTGPGSISPTKAAVWNAVAAGRHSTNAATMMTTVAWATYNRRELRARLSGISQRRYDYGGWAATQPALEYIGLPASLPGPKRDLILPFRGVGCVVALAGSSPMSAVGGPVSVVSSR